MNNLTFILSTYVDNAEELPDLKEMIANVLHNVENINDPETIKDTRLFIAGQFASIFGDLSEAFTPEYKRGAVSALMHYVMEDEIEWDKIIDPYFNEALENEKAQSLER